MNLASLSATIAGVNYPVIKAEGVDDLHNYAQFDLDILVPNETTVINFINADAALQFSVNDLNRTWSAWVRSVEIVGVYNAGQIVRLELHSPLARLLLRQQARIWQAESFKALIAQLLAEYGFTATWAVQKKLVSKPYWQQAAIETDWQFLKRLLAQQALFVVSNDDGSLLFTDNNERLNMALTDTLQYRVQLSDVTATATPQRLELCGKTHIPVLSAGSCVNLDTNEFDRSYSATYLITQVQHDFDARSEYVDEQLRYQEEGSFTSPLEGEVAQSKRSEDGRVRGDNTTNYFNIFIAQPRSTPYPIIPIELPAMPPALTARIDANTAQNVLDSSGNTHTKLYLDRRDIDMGEALPTLPRVQSNLGPATPQGQSSGIHLPPAPNSDVLVTYQQGDPDEVFILASVPNNDHASPVIAASSTQHRWRTPQGQESVFEDTKDAQHIHVKTSDELNRLQLNAKNGTHQLNMESLLGEIRVRVEQGLMIVAADWLEKTVAHHVTRVKASYQSTTKDGDIHQQTKKNISHTAQQTIRQQSQKDLHILSGGDATLDAKQSFTAVSTDGNLLMHAEQGDVIIQSVDMAHIIGAGKGTISLNNQMSGLQIDKDGKLTLFGQNMQTVASDGVEIHGNINYGAPAASPPIPPKPEIAKPADIDKIETDAHKTKQCSNVPTPAPQSIIGTCDYYQFRHDDFVKRHANCGKHPKPPSYYLDYGLKYCKKFSAELYPKLSPVGKVWLPKSRRLLQVILEKALHEAAGSMSEKYTNRHHPIANELNSNEFTDYVFHSHIEAYEEAGFDNISVEDVKNIIEIIDLKDDFNADTYETGTVLLGNYAGKNITRYSTKTMNEIRYKVSHAITTGD